MSALALASPLSSPSPCLRSPVLVSEPEAFELPATRIATRADARDRKQDQSSRSTGRMRKSRLGDAYMVVVAVLLDDVVMLEKR